MKNSSRQTLSQLAQTTFCHYFTTRVLKKCEDKEVLAWYSFPIIIWGFNSRSLDKQMWVRSG